jgi:hypothetical protein
MDQILLLLVELRRWIAERWIEVGSMDRLILLFGDEELRRWIEEGSMDRRWFEGSDGSKMGR